MLCLFLLDMGLVAGRGLRESRGELGGGAVVFGVIMPLIGSAFGLLAALAIGLSPGGAALLMTLSASASYIAVPAAMRVALPEARPSIYLTLSLRRDVPVQPDDRHPALHRHCHPNRRRLNPWKP